jgi:hypothetical protein
MLEAAKEECKSTAEEFRSFVRVSQGLEASEGYFVTVSHGLSYDQF